MQVETRPAPRTERPAFKPNVTNKQVVNIPDDTPSSASSEVPESPSRSGTSLTFHFLLFIILIFF